MFNGKSETAEEIINESEDKSEEITQNLMQHRHRSKKFGYIEYSVVVRAAQGRTRQDRRLQFCVSEKGIYIAKLHFVLRVGLFLKLFRLFYALIITYKRCIIKI